MNILDVFAKSSAVCVCKCKIFCFAVVVVGTWRLCFLFVFNCKYLFVHFPLRYLPTSDVNADKDEATFSKGFRFVSFSFSLAKHFRDAYTHTYPQRGGKTSDPDL